MKAKQKGLVVSNKMDKTAVVKITTRYQHPLFKKYVVRQKKYKVHDPNNECNVGDLVEFRQCRPLSKEKRWLVTGIVEKAV